MNIRHHKLQRLFILVVVRVLNDVLGQLLSLLRSTQEASPILLKLLFKLHFCDLAGGEHLKGILLVYFESEREIAGTQDFEDLEKKFIFLKLVDNILLCRFGFFCLVWSDLLNWVNQVVRVKLSHVKPFAALKQIDGNHSRILRLLLNLTLVQEERHILSGLWLVILIFLVLAISNLSNPQPSVNCLSNFLFERLNIFGVEVLHFGSRQNLIHSKDEYVLGGLLGSASSCSILDLRLELVVLRLSAGCCSLSRHVVNDCDAIDLCILSVARLIFNSLGLKDDELEKELLLLHPLVSIVFDAFVIHRVLFLQSLDHQVLFAFIQSHHFSVEEVVLL